MKLSDYIIDFLYNQGAKHIFLIAGGAINHCVDSAGKHPFVKVICPQHEQAAGAAADAYARSGRGLGVAMVTSGPGATNLVTSVCNAYYDSVPLIVICGQVATFRLKQSNALRQKGFQETGVTSIFESITKYTVRITSADQIRYELERAVSIAKEGRPGPVLLDIPDDIQRAEIDPETLRAYENHEAIPLPDISPEARSRFTSLLAVSERPLVIFGAGVSISHQRDRARKWLEQLHIPAVLTWGAKDLLPDSHELNMGGIGVCGPRYGNFAVQSADLIIAIGTRLSQMIVGGKQELFAPKARKVLVELDPEEIKKFTNSGITLDLAINVHLKCFFRELGGEPLTTESKPSWSAWTDRIREWKEKYPVCTSSNLDRTIHADGVVFMKMLSKFAPSDCVIVGDTGANLAWLAQAFEVSGEQRLISAWNHSPMGYALPASVGACLATQKDVLCVTGDGGIMMSLEELGTIRRHDLPVKIFVLYNGAHAIQRQSMDTWMDSRYTAVDVESGLFFPDFHKVGEGFGIPTVRIDSNDRIEDGLTQVFKQQGPVLCIVETSPDQGIVPLLRFGAGLDDLEPRLPKSEIEAILTTMGSHVCNNSNALSMTF